jgi:hypothetical protein
LGGLVQCRGLASIREKRNLDLGGKAIAEARDDKSYAIEG